MNILGKTSGVPKDLTEKYQEVLEKILKESTAKEDLIKLLETFVATILREEVSLVVSRPLLADLANHLQKLPNEVTKTVSHFIITNISQRLISFEEQVAAIRQHLASIYENESEWEKAAQILVLLTI